MVFLILLPCKTPFGFSQVDPIQEQARAVRLQSVNEIKHNLTVETFTRVSRNVIDEVLLCEKILNLIYNEEILTSNRRIIFNAGASFKCIVWVFGKQKMTLRCSGFADGEGTGPGIPIPSICVPDLFISP